MIIQEIVKSKHFYKAHTMLWNLRILQILNYLILITTLSCALLLSLFYINEEIEAKEVK